MGDLRTITHYQPQRQANGHTQVILSPLRLPIPPPGQGALDDKRSG